MIHTKSQNRNPSSRGRDSYGYFGSMYGGNENQFRYNNYGSDSENESGYDDDDSYYNTGSFDRNDRYDDEDNDYAQGNYYDYENNFDDRYEDLGDYGNRAGRDEGVGPMYDEQNRTWRTENNRNNYPGDYHSETGRYPGRYSRRNSERPGYGPLGRSSTYGNGRGHSGASSRFNGSFVSRKEWDR